MKKSLVILAHSNLNNSRVNKRWKEELEKYEDKILIHDLYKEYPERKNKIKKEKMLLESHENIIIQFPFYWYSSPP